MPPCAAAAEPPTTTPPRRHDVVLLPGLLLADGRFPSGAHAHSGGLEAAVTAGLVHDVADLRAWVVGCLHTTWLVEACVAVAAAERADDLPALTRLDTELEARTTAPLQRHASRALGRQLLRAGRAAFPHPQLDGLRAIHPDGPPVPLVHGVLAGLAGLGAEQVAITWLHLAVQGATSAAVRLLGLDPYAVLTLTAGLHDRMAAVAGQAVVDSQRDPADLPAAGAPMLDVLLATHADRDGRLFTT